MKESIQISFQNNEEELKQIMGGSARKDDCNGKDKDALLIQWKFQGR